jgi:hypothetical protein
MQPIKIQIPDHLILPFGTARKFDIGSIKLSAAAANGIYLTSDVPCVYIDRTKKEPLMMSDWKVLPNHVDEVLNYMFCSENPMGILDHIHTWVEECMPVDTTTTPYERMFLRLYFDYIKGCLKHAYPCRGNPWLLWNALLPIPQMHLYVYDPLEDDRSGSLEPSNNFKVDFGFWTGTRLIAAEIDGDKPSGYLIRRDRLLRRAGVDVIHILNTEIKEHGRGVIQTLFPREITDDWQEDRFDRPIKY